MNFYLQLIASIETEIFLKNTDYTDLQIMSENTQFSLNETHLF